MFDVGYKFGGIRANRYFSEKGNINVLDFPLAFTMGQGKPTDLGVEEGKVKNWFMSLYRNFGLFITYEDGTCHIADKGKLKISELYKDRSKMKVADRIFNLGDINDYTYFLRIAKEEKLSINTNMLLINDDYNVIINDGKDWRRLLLEFKDGSFGVLNMTVQASTGEATMIALALDAVKRAIYADTGYYDFTTLHTLNKGPVILGHSDNPASSNRIFFYQDNTTQKQITPSKPLSKASISEKKALLQSKNTERIKLAVRSVTIEKQLEQFGDNKKLREELAYISGKAKKLNSEIKRLHKSIIVDQAEETLPIAKSRTNILNVGTRRYLNSSI